VDGSDGGTGAAWLAIAVYIWAVLVTTVGICGATEGFGGAAEFCVVVRKIGGSMVMGSKSAVMMEDGGLVVVAYGKVFSSKVPWREIRTHCVSISRHL
jgi:hypothetical protein